MESLQIINHSWVSSCDIDKETTVRQQLLMHKLGGRWDQSCLPLAQNPLHPCPLLHQGQYTHSQFRCNVDKQASPSSWRLAARSGLPSCVLDAKVTLRRCKSMTGLPSQFRIWPGDPLIIHKREHIARDSSILPLFGYPRVTRIVPLRSWEI